MANEAITYRRRIRQRLDLTAIHRTGLLDAVNAVEDIRIDIVASQLTVAVPLGLTVTVTASLDGTNFFALPAGFIALTNGMATYGKGASDHLVKVLRFTRSAGAGQAAVVAV